MELFVFDFGVMGCPASVRFYGKDEQTAASVMELIHTELNRLNDKYSNYSAYSFVADINRSAGNPQGIWVDEETAILLDYSQACYSISQGLFDITAGILFKAWDFHAPNPALPSRHSLNQLLACVGWEKVQWNRPHLVLPIPGMVLDFGGVVKEYAVDRCVALCRENGIYHGVVEIGGDLSVIGPKPDGSGWRVGIQDPFSIDKDIFFVDLIAGAVATSGDYARYINIDGERYCHIMNPVTGMPIRSVGSVTVIADHCLVAGSSSTIAFLMEKEGVEWLKAQDLPFAFVGNDKQVVYRGVELIANSSLNIQQAA